MPSPVLARADALMKRKRAAGEEELPVLTDVIVDQEGIPVLLDADMPATDPGQNPIAPTPSSDTQSNRLPEPAISAPAASSKLSAQADQQLVQELARRIEQRIQAELPGIIATVVRDYLSEPAEPPQNPGKR